MATNGVDDRQKPMPYSRWQRGAKRRSHVEDQVKWLRFGASDASDYASLL